MGGVHDQQPVGAIFDTNSDGRFDLVVYVDGLLGVKGTYIGVAIRAAGAGMVGAGGGGIGGGIAAGAGSAAGFAAGGSYEAKRLARVLETSRAELVQQSPNFFISRESIRRLVLRKRWHGHSLRVETPDAGAGRKFEWKPALNKFSQVHELLESTFPGLVVRE